MEGQGQVYLAGYPLVLKELEFWERVSSAVKVSCSPLSLPVLAYSNGHSHAQTPAPAGGEKTSLKESYKAHPQTRKRQTTEHTKTGVKGEVSSIAQDLSDYKMCGEQRVRCSAMHLPFCV